MKTPKPLIQKTDDADRNRGFILQRNYGWVMLLLLWLLNAVFSLIVRAIGPLVTPIVRDLHLSYTQMGFILGSWQLTYIGASMIAGTIIDRWGIRKSLLAGTLTIGLSAALRYFPTGFGEMLGAVALFGAGGPLISVGCPKTIALWFEGRQRGTALGIYLTGAWAGSILGLTLTNSVVMPFCGYNWRLTFLFFGACALAAASLWWFFAREPASPALMEELSAFELLIRLFKVRRVQVVLALGLLTFAIFHGFTHWLPRILEGKNFSPAIAGFVASLPFAGGIPSLLIIPRLVPPHRRPALLGVGAIAALITFPFITSSSGGFQLTALILFGIIVSPFIPLLTALLMDTPEVGPGHMGAAGGMFFCISEIGGFAGPLIMGASVDLTGDFLGGAVFFAVLCLFFAVLTLFLKNKS
jgi:CP family cyanate transporter-like MFS transporter